MHLKMLSAKWRPFSLALNVLGDKLEIQKKMKETFETNLVMRFTAGLDLSAQTQLKAFRF